jgi:hypothetical protein
MWDTRTRIPFDMTLVREHPDPDDRATLLATIAAEPGVTVDDLYARRLPGLFADLRSLYSAGLLRASTTPPRFFERATRLYAEQVPSAVPVEAPRP